MRLQIGKLIMAWAVDEIDDLWQLISMNKLISRIVRFYPVLLLLYVFFFQFRPHNVLKEIFLLLFHCLCMHMDSATFQRNSFLGYHCLVCNGKNKANKLKRSIVDHKRFCNCHQYYYQIHQLPAWPNSWHVGLPPLISPQIDVWGTTAVIPYRWFTTTQIWAVLLICWKFALWAKDLPKGLPWACFFLDS